METLERPSIGQPPTISPLQLMQARFQRKLLQDKQEIMTQLYPATNNNNNMTRGGAVRQFFAQRRANNNHNDEDLLSKTGLISLQQSFNSSWSNSSFNRPGGGAGAGPKQGSPVGWDKSYPLSPLDRDSSGGSSSGYDSGNAVGSPYLSTVSQTGSKKPQQRANKQLAPARPNGQQQTKTTVNNNKKATRRTPSLDRYGSNGRGNWNQQQQTTMRRSNSQQVLTSSNHAKENETHALKVQRPAQPKKKPAALAPSKLASSPSPPPSKDLLVAQQVPKSRKPVVPSIEPKSNQHQAASKQAGGGVGKRSAGPTTSVDPSLVECQVCGRRFAPDRIDKHMTVCEKTTKKKRKVFDPTKMRTQGTEMEEYVSKTKGKGHKPEPPQVKKDWRAKRENFIETLRQAKMVQKHLAAGGNIADLPPPPPMDTSDYLQCPYCDRKFSEAAAERHIPKCQNIKSNKRLDRK